MLLRHSEAILARFVAAHADVDSVATRAAGVVRVAGLETFGPRRVAKILSLFRQQQPFAQVVLDNEPPGNAALERLRDGTLDILVDEPPTGHESLTHLVLEHDEYVLVVPDRSELLTRSAPITAAEIAAARPIVPAPCAASEALGRQLVELAIRRHPSLAPDSVSTAYARSSPAGSPPPWCRLDSLTPRRPAPPPSVSPICWPRR